MFLNLVEKAFHYSNPWDHEPVELRLAELDADCRRVAWVYEKPDTSTFRYRVYNMVESLRSCTERQVVGSWFTRDEIPALVSKLPGIDTLVLSRVRYDAAVGGLIAAARAHRVRVLFDCDDLVFDSRHVHLLLDTLDQDTRTEAGWDWWFAYIGRLEATARLCDGGISTNPFLARLMEGVVEGPVAVVPNFLNRRQQEVSDTLLAAKAERGFVGTGPVTVGYFSGTPSHNRDFAVAAPALAALLDRDHDVRLRVVGFMEAFGPLARHRDRMERVPLQDWLNLQRVIAEVEVNIAPLQLNVFTNCKSELKFFEAAAVGTWTVASPTSTFTAAIRSAHTGRLSRSEEWDAALEEAVDLVRDPSCYAPVAQHNATMVRSDYGWNRFGKAIVAATLRPT